MSISPLFPFGHVLLVQEGGNHGCTQTHPPKFRKFTWKLSVRQVVCAGSRQDQGPPGMFTVPVEVYTLIQSTFQAKFDKNELHRRPEFEDRVSESPVPHGQAAGASSSTKNKEPRVKVEHESHKAEVPIAYVPRHLRQEMAVAQHAQAQAQTPVSAVSSPSHEAPPHTLTHMSASGSGSDTASTPANRGSPSVNTPKSHGLATPIQTPTQPQRPPPPRVPPPRAVATSPLARMRSAPEPSAPPMPPPMPARAESADPMDDTDLGNRQAIDKDDDDAFPISTQDDAFLATVDLGEGDLGRPIDFDEGVGSVSVMDASMLEQEQKPPAPPPQPQYQHQVRDGESSAGSERGGTYNPSTRNDAQVQPVANPPSRSAGQGQPLPRSGSTSGSASTYTPSMSSTRTGPPVQDIKRPMTISMGGSHYPPGTVCLSPKRGRGRHLSDYM